MKTIIAILFFAMVALNTPESRAGQPNVSPSVTIVETHAALTAREVKGLTNRLKEIRTLSKTNLTAGEKASLREEVITIREQLNTAAAGGVYISVGALILIIILLIILL